MKNIMFIAPPAAGKGTQAEIVVKKYNLPHIYKKKKKKDTNL